MEKIPNVKMRKKETSGEIYESGRKYGLYQALAILLEDKKIKEFYNFKIKLEEASETQSN